MYATFGGHAGLGGDGLCTGLLHRSWCYCALEHQCKGLYSAWLTKGGGERQIPNEFLTFRDSRTEVRHPIRLYSRYINKARPCPLRPPRSAPPAPSVNVTAKGNPCVVYQIECCGKVVPSRFVDALLTVSLVGVHRLALNSRWRAAKRSASCSAFKPTMQWF